MVNLILYAYFKNPVYYLLMACVMVFFVVLLAVMKLYKSSVYNSLDPWLLFFLTVAYIGLSIRFVAFYMAPKELLYYNKYIDRSRNMPSPTLWSGSACFQVKRFITWMAGLIKQRQEMEESLHFQRREYTCLS